MSGIKRLLALVVMSVTVIAGPLAGSSWSDDGHHGEKHRSEHSDREGQADAKKDEKSAPKAPSEPTTTTSKPADPKPAPPQSGDEQGKDGEHHDQPKADQPKSPDDGSKIKVDLANFACSRDNSGIWQAIRDEQTGAGNHDNLVLRGFSGQVHPGDQLTLEASWEIRDWTPGTLLTLRNCNDIDGPSERDGKATVPHLDFGTNLLDRIVIQPAHSPDSYVIRGERRELATATLKLRVPNTAPVGGEFCSRVAVFTDAQGSGHRFSPPLFDISPTTCVTVVATPLPLPVIPPPTVTPAAAPVISLIPPVTIVRPKPVVAPELARTGTTVTKPLLGWSFDLFLYGIPLWLFGRKRRVVPLTVRS